MKKFTILLIDDEETQLKALKSFLERRNYRIFTASTGEEGFHIAEEELIDLVITDYRMPGWNGLIVLRKIRELNPEIDVVVLTAFGSIEDAVEIMKAGAYDYLTKPVDLQELENLVMRVKERRMLLDENRHLREQLKDKFRFDAIVSQSGEMEAVLNMASRVAESKASVLIRGESGTGKELIARAIHFASPRKNKPFVVVNIAALAPNLIESELFGHEKGAFTGASQRRIGKFEQADGGTLFVDEVGDIPPPVQVKLLRAIQFGEVERIGGSEPVKTDVRIIAATHRRLEDMIESRDFREDLYYRLNVVTIHVPPLRKRKSDIPLLTDFFIRKYSSENNRDIRGVSREAMDWLMKYEFPGNVRELENMMERAVVLSRSETIEPADLPFHTRDQTVKSVLDPYNLDNSYEEKVRSFERELIETALKETEGNQSAAARILDMTERHLRSRMEKLGMKK